MTRKRSLLAIASTLFGMVAFLMFVATRLPVNHAIAQVVMMLVGMLAIASVSTISRYVDATTTAQLIPISFNEVRARHALDDPKSGLLEATKDTEYRPQPWEVTSDTLMTQDPALALAKLRIDLEREIRRIAYQHDVAVSTRRGSISQIMDALVARKVIDPSLNSAVCDVLPVCNLAIHGGHITPEVAAGVLDVGEDIIRIFRARF